MNKIFSIFSILSMIASVSGAVRTIEVDVFPMAEFAPPFRYQLLGRGMDSWKNSWRLDYSQKSFTKKAAIGFSTGNGWTFSAPAKLSPFRKNRVTAVFDGKKAALYLNGTLLAEKETSFLVPENNYELWIGRYAKSKNRLFPGKVSNVRLSEKITIPEKTSFGKDPKQYFFYQASTENKPAFKALSGNWHFNSNGYGESTDNRAISVFSLLPVNLPEDFVLTTGVVTRDNTGSIHLEFCRKDAQNTYLLTHKNMGSGLVFLSLFKKQNDRLFILGEALSTQISIPENGSFRKPLFISIGCKGEEIHVRINDREVISVIDQTFRRGKVCLGLQGRKADFCRISLSAYPEYCAAMRPIRLKPLELKVKSKTLRQVFYRNEKIRLTAEFFNRTTADFSPAETKIAFAGKTQIWKTPVVHAGKSVQHNFVLDGRDLRSGTYPLTLSSGKHTVKMSITLVERKPEDHYAFSNSRHNIAVEHLKKLTPTLLNGSGFTLPAGTNLEHLRPIIAQANDYAMLNKMDMGLRLPMLRNTDANKKHMRIVRKDGSRSPLLDPWRPDVRAHFKKEFEKILIFFKDYPSFKYFNLDSEVENHVEPDYSQAGIARAQKVLGFAPPMAENSAVELDNTAGRKIRLPEKIRKATPPVFSPKDQNYLYMRYFWEQGIGDNFLREEMLPVIRKHIPDAVIFHNPWRNVILGKRMTGHDLIGTWFYCHPDAGATHMAIEAMLAGCRAAKVPERFTTAASLWLYNQRMGPARQKWAGVQPTDITLISFHLTFAAKPEFMELYDISFLFPESKAQFREANTKSEITRFIRTYVRPLWSTVQKLDRDKNKSALLISVGTQVFSRSRWGGYGCEPANIVLDLLWKAQIPSGIVTEETILNGELSQYDRLFLHQTSHIPADVREKILQFLQKGGKVYAESSSPWIKLIPGVRPLEIPVEIISKSSYYDIRKGKGFTADKVYAEQQRIAGMLRSTIGKEIKNAAESPSTEVFIRSLNKNNSHYIFVINDRRTFCDYFGKKYKAVYEAGVPQKVRVKVNVPGTVYLYPDGKKLQLKNKECLLQLDRADCKVLIVYPEEVKNIEFGKVPVFIPGEKAEFKISVLGKSGKVLKGIQPLHIRLTAPDKKVTEHYTSAINGTLRWAFTPGKNDVSGIWKLTVRELASGKENHLLFSRK